MMMATFSDVTIFLVSIFLVSIFLVSIFLVSGYDGPPTRNYALPTWECEEKVACFGSRDNITAYGLRGETVENSCIKGNGCPIRIRAGRFESDQDKVWWELQVPAANNFPDYPDAVHAMFWVSKTRSNKNKPNGRVAFRAKLWTSLGTVKVLVKQNGLVLVSPQNNLVTNSKMKGFQFSQLLSNQHWEDDPRLYRVNFVNIFSFNSSTILSYEDARGNKCYYIDLLNDAVFLHLTLQAPTLNYAEQVVSDSPIKLFEPKTATSNNPSMKGRYPIVNSVACSVESANDNHTVKPPTLPSTTPFSTTLPSTTQRLPPVSPIRTVPPEVPVSVVTNPPPIEDGSPPGDDDDGPVTSAPTITTTHTHLSTRILPNMSTDKDTKKQSSMIFYVLGGILLAALVLIAIFFCSCKKKNRKREPIKSNEGIEAPGKMDEQGNVRSNIGSMKTVSPRDNFTRSRMASDQARPIRSSGSSGSKRSGKKVTPQRPASPNNQAMRSRMNSIY